MPNIKSAKKRVTVTKVKTARNKATRSNLKTVLKTARVSLEAQSDTRGDAVKLAVKKLDQAAGKNVIHKNKAARLKSQLARKLG